MGSYFCKSRPVLLLALAFVMATASFAPVVAPIANAAESARQRAVTAIQSDSAAPRCSVLTAESRAAETLLTQLQQKQWVADRRSLRRGSARGFLYSACPAEVAHAARTSFFAGRAYSLIEV